MATDDRVRAALDEIRSELAVSGATNEHERRLLAIADLMLELADEWEAKGPGSSVLTEDRALTRLGCAQDVREAVAAELLGKEPDGG